jgi:hypothetical protein
MPLPQKGQTRPWPKKNRQCQWHCLSFLWQ